MDAGTAPQRNSEHFADASSALTYGWLAIETML
jgi:hypothetical protein